MHETVVCELKETIDLVSTNVENRLGDVGEEDEGGLFGLFWTIFVASVLTTASGRREVDIENPALNIPGRLRITLVTPTTGWDIPENSLRPGKDEECVARSLRISRKSRSSCALIMSNIVLESRSMVSKAFSIDDGKRG